MRMVIRTLLLVFIALAVQHLSAPRAPAQQHGARSRAAQRGFAGDWEAASYPTSRDELPPFYKDAPLKDVPRFSLSLSIRQRGDRLTGRYGATERYLAKVEDGRFDAVVRNGEALFHLVSGFRGRVVASISLLGGDRLRWKLVKSEGENYFPRDVTLRRRAVRGAGKRPRS